MLLFFFELQHRASTEGQVLRSDNQHRPFVLSRAFFSGSQRYGEERLNRCWEIFSQAKVGLFTALCFLLQVPYGRVITQENGAT